MNSAKVTALAETVACVTNAFKYHKRKVPADEIAVVSLNCLTDMGAKYFNSTSALEVPVVASDVSVDASVDGGVKKCACGGHM